MKNPLPSNISQCSVWVTWQPHATLSRKPEPWLWQVYQTKAIRLHRKSAQERINPVRVHVNNTVPKNCSMCFRGVWLAGGSGGDHHQHSTWLKIPVAHLACWQVETWSRLTGSTVCVQHLVFLFVDSVTVSLKGEPLSETTTDAKRFSETFSELGVSVIQKKDWSN